MNPLISDMGFNGALAAAAVTTVAAIRRVPRLAVIAALVAWIGIGLDYWFGPSRGFLSSPNFWSRGTEEPISWQPFAQAVDPGDPQTKYSTLEMIGRNISEHEVKLRDAYFVSGVTGEQVNLKVQIIPLAAAIADINPIPPAAIFALITTLGPDDDTGITAADFLKTWGPFSFVVEYDDEKTYRIDLNRQDAIKLVTQQTDMPLFPRVTLRNPNRTR